MSLNARLYDAASDGKLREVKSLLKQGASANHISRFSGPVLTAAASLDHHKVVECLIDHGAEVDLKYMGTALINASKQGHYRTVKVLLRCKADIHLSDAHGKTALIHASENGHPE